MPTRSDRLDVQGIPVAVARKRIRHVYVIVSRATGAVRVSAPSRADDRLVRSVVESKLAWILAKRREAAARQPVPELRYAAGEIHWVWGRPHRLTVADARGRPTVRLGAVDVIAMQVGPDTTSEQRRGLLDAWYRDALRARIPDAIARWEPAVGHSVAAWGVKKMKTRWGSCNPTARRIWLNLELAKRPTECLEYVVVHEMAHLIEANHGPGFYALLDRLMPEWRAHRDALHAPLGGAAVDG